MTTTPELLVAAAILVALVVYALTGGADFGGGVWDLFAGRGERAERQRKLIEHAIAPIWEANHVWLIIVVVLLFVCFPVAFSAIATALHIPLTLMLIGIVLRGSAFVFRSYGIQSEEASRRWSRIFAGSSVVTPYFLGVSLGAVASGPWVFDAETGVLETDFVREWLAPFPLVIGALVLALFAYLAAVYLILEAGEDEVLREAFRRRALVSAVVVAVCAAAGLVAAWSGPARIWDRLVATPAALVLQLGIAVSAVAALVLLWTRRDRAARVAAAAQVTLIVGGFGLAQYPYLLPPSLELHDAGAPANVLWATLAVLGVGAVALVPAFWMLYRIFKGRVGGAPRDPG